MGDGAADEAKGRVKEAAGSLTDDDSLKNEGKVDKASGTVKDTVGDAADKIKDAIAGKDRLGSEERPDRGSLPGRAAFIAAVQLSTCRRRPQAAAWPGRPARRRTTCRRRRCHRSRSPRAPSP